MSKFPNIHLLGIQGCGKGTQSALLVEKYHLNYLASGDLFRNKSKIKDELGLEISKLMNQGKLLPDNLLVNTIDSYLDENIIKVGVLGDGVIRTIGQSILLNPIWLKYNLDQPLIIHFVLDEDEAQKRIQNRMNTAEHEDKQHHHLKYSGKLLKRKDDNPKAIHERFKLYRHLSGAILSNYRQINRCIDIDANQSIENIFKNTSKVLEEFYPNLNNELN